METKDKTLHRLQFMDMVQEILENLRAMWTGKKEIDNPFYSKHGCDGEAEVAYSSDGLTARIWVERGDDSMFGKVSLEGIFDVEYDASDEFNDKEDELVPVLFWKVYERCMKAPDLEW